MCLDSISICITKPHKLVTRHLQAVQSLMQAWLAYARLAFYKPAASLWQALYMIATRQLQIVLYK